MLFESEDVRHHLAGMGLLGQAVDDRNRRVARQFLHVGMVENADHDRVDIARKNARGVGEGFAAAQLHLGARKHDRFAAELAHRQIERDARARRGTIEDHRQRLARQRL